MHESNKQSKQVVCGIYARSATVNPSAVARQIAACKQFAQEHGWANDERYIYQDHGLGGNKTIGRPALEQLMSSLQNPACPINLLLVEEANRLGRDLSLIAGILDVLVVRGISVYAAETKMELTSPTGRQLLSAMHPLGYAQLLRKSLLQKQ